MNVALVLVYLRMAAIAPIVLLLGQPDPSAAAWALVLFVVAALTDLVDGPIARRLGQVTRLGTFLDPLADKLLIVGTLIGLGARGLVPSWIVVLVVARELVVTNLRAVAAARGYSIGASTYGKAKTAMQSLAIAALLLVLTAPSLALAEVAYALLAAAVGLTLLSGAAYLWQASWAMAGRGVPARWRAAPRPDGDVRGAAR
ncbi:MAG: CDP-diacylglycerol--glycerol-3-phosphate 3-phosphatidyltransferase [Chloroflexota bacterium]|nr:CDP-diacylglycerol--glycerol-3-phosphate 3-phosphatidyltransferase [Chloroflexota bacterium]